MHPICEQRAIRIVTLKNARTSLVTLLFGESRGGRRLTSKSHTPLTIRPTGGLKSAPGLKLDYGNHLTLSARPYVNRYIQYREIWPNCYPSPACGLTAAGNVGCEILTNRFHQRIGDLVAPFVGQQ